MWMKFLNTCGYRKFEDVADFLMTGAAVVPVVVFFGSGLGAAIIAMLLCLLPGLALLPWLDARADIARQEAEAREAERVAYLRQITGGRR